MGTVCVDMWSHSSFVEGLETHKLSSRSFVSCISTSYGMVTNP
jgi:hypothetical protein